jgi:hypothetical protein
LVSMTEFETPSALLLMFTSTSEETRRWLEMLEMAQKEFRRLKMAENGDETRIRGPFDQLSDRVVHRKSSSMDSQVVAAHAQLARRCLLTNPRRSAL